MIKRIVSGLKDGAVTAWNGRGLLGGLGPSAAFVLRGRRAPLLERRAGWRGMPLIMRWSDWPAVCEVLIEEEYKIAQRCLSGVEKPVVVDLGANVGTFSLYVLNALPAAEVHAYEASAATFALLKQNRELNPRFNWTVHHAAAWREDGSISFETTTFSVGSRVSASGKESVPARSLSSILAAIPAARIDLMKVDIEGAEEATLVGRLDELKRVACLIVELHPGRCDTGRVVETLRAVYTHLYEIPGRGSIKPLLLAAHQEFPLPRYAPPPHKHKPSPGQVVPIAPAGEVSLP